jgi:predicted nucleic-acid-binding protein
MPLPVLDTNILIRHLTQDHPDHSPQATAYLQRIRHRNLKARLPLVVLFETVYTLQSFCKVPKEQIRSVLLPLIMLRGVVLVGKRRVRRVFDYYVTLNISFADAYIAVEMEDHGDTQIVSFDCNYDKIGSIKRVEPDGIPRLPTI